MTAAAGDDGGGAACQSILHFKSKLSVFTLFFLGNIFKMLPCNQIKREGGRGRKEGKKSRKEQTSS